ncbi:hypothetical protein KPH14_001563 [Odynerus spinipes]|uniref:Uncharacterized protein n=1 Tax=Odynerus spinipes TaxID=1348599 RepID=A0AAD9VWH3_9HYME|nr:hypothetical protein KPH14_001563 [Odynerus spinipes]
MLSVVGRLGPRPLHRRISTRALNGPHEQHVHQPTGSTSNVEDDFVRATLGTATGHLSYILGLVEGIPIGFQLGFLRVTGQEQIPIGYTGV